MIIRKIAIKDNKKLETIIKDTIVEFGLPTTGTAYEDKDTLAMFEAYQKENEAYFVIEMNNKVVAGGGIKPLADGNGKICELQKMYMLPEARGKGYGKKLFNTCLQTAKELGFKQCYLESDPSMKSAINLYEKNGFKHLDRPLGTTGHTACGIWMLKDL